MCVRADSSACFDLIICGQISRDLLHAQEQSVARVGGVAYAASVSARLGACTGIIAPLTDPEGASVIAELTQRGIDCEGVNFVAGDPLVYEIRDADEVVEQTVLRSGPAASCLPFAATFPQSYLGARCALLYPVWLPFAVSVARELRASGTLIAADLQHDISSLEEAQDLFRLCDYVFISLSALLQITRAGTLDSAISRVREVTRATLVVKMGLAGSLICGDQAEPVEIPAYLSDYHFTVGAGDAYDAAFLVARMRGMNLMAAGVAGSLAAANVIESSDRDPSKDLVVWEEQVRRQAVFLHPRDASTIRIYIAGHANSLPLRRWMEHVADAVERLGMCTFVPHRVIASVHEPESGQSSVPEQQSEGRRTSNAVLALLDGDAGGEVYVDIGAAMERGLPVICLCTDETMRLPAMVRRASEAIVGDLTGMTNALMQRFAEFPRPA